MTSNEGKKGVQNQLFNPSVTGGTYEDFSHNAVLFAVQDVSKNASPPLVPDSSDDNKEKDADFHNFDNLQVQDEIPLSDQSTQDNQTSQLSSLFSSFSNILTFSDGSLQSQNSPNNFLPVQNFDQAPHTIENIAPVPLFPSTQLKPNLTSSASESTLLQNNPPSISNSFSSQEVTTGNNYRRPTTKKVSYAQIPGLLNTSSQPVTPVTSSQNLVTVPLLSHSSFQVNPNVQQQPILHPSPAHTLPTRVASSILEETATDISIISNQNSEIYGISNSSNTTVANTPQLFNPSAFSTEVPVLDPTSYSSSNTSTSLMHPLLETEVPRGGFMPRSISHASYTSGAVMQTYRPIYHHWFYRREHEKNVSWQPFSMLDSLALEEAYTSTDVAPETLVPTEGGRYDVNILRREKSPVYWQSEPFEVRRCSWFYKAPANAEFIPYEENVATMLENEYKIAFESGEWHRKVELSSGETVVMHGPDVLALFPPSVQPDPWGTAQQQTQNRLKIIKRGLDEFDIDEGEPGVVDHLLFIVHGIGSVCDLKLRTVEEVVDQFRSISLKLVRSHYKSASENEEIGRVEVLPISWHGKLHSEETGVDKHLKNITLESIPRLRDFTNDTLLDILFYTSPIYCQTIINTVGFELNRIYELFKTRNPGYKGGVSIGGHSLGSLIVFDLLCHQHVEDKKDVPDEGDEDIVPPLTKPPPRERLLRRRISYMMSAAGTGQPQLHYPHLNFSLSAFFALGSPIGMFVTVRGLKQLGIDFTLPTCPAFFNIFHPYDPVAYRIESLVNPEFTSVKPVLIPHHKGRKRMHLELKDTVTRMGADIKQKLMDSMKSTWNTLFSSSLFGRQDMKAPSLEEEVNKVLEENFALEESKHLESQANQSVEEQKSDLYVGALNKGRRIDYVLQEAPFECINDYIFALTSHIGYWESQDTILLILKEIYESLGVSPDNKIPQINLSSENTPVPSNYPSSYPSTSTQVSAVGMDPTMPISSNVNIGPPPTQGFVRKL